MEKTINECYEENLRLLDNESKREVYFQGAKDQNILDNKEHMEDIESIKKGFEQVIIIEKNELLNQVYEWMSSNFVCGKPYSISEFESMMMNMRKSIKI